MAKTYFTHRDVVEARLAGNMKKLTRASLGRVWQHVQKHKIPSLGIISAFRLGGSEPERRQNIIASDELMKHIRRLELGAFQLIGYWKSCKDEPETAWDDGPKCERASNRDITFAIPGITLKDLIALGNDKRFDQNAVIYTGPESKGKVWLIELKKGNSIRDLGSFTPAKVARAYSRVHEPQFVFEALGLPALCWMDAILEQAMTRENRKGGKGK